MGLRVEERTRLLVDLASALTAASTELGTVLDRAVRATATLIGDGGLIRLANADGVFDRAAVHHPDPQLSESLQQLLTGLDQRADDGFAGKVRRLGRPVVRNDLTTAQLRTITGPQLWPHLSRLDLGAILMVPLVADGTYLGHLSAARHGRGRPYTDEDVEMAADIAARVALAVRTATVVETLRSEREQYRQILETSFEGIWKVGPDGVTTFTNTRMADILATSVAQLRGSPLIRWIADADREEHVRRMAQRREGAVGQYEVRLRRADGELVWVRVTASPIRDEAGTVVGSLAMVTDITDRVRNSELQDRLAQMQRLDSLGQLVGGIAHDFNNLLTIVGGAADLILLGLPPGSPLTPLAEQVVTAVQHGASLTRQLLTFGRGTPGQADVVDVTQVLTELAPMLRRTLGEHVHLHVPSAQDGNEPCHVRIGHGQLQQVIINLAVNARDAMPDGGTLSIECERTVLDRAELGDPAGVDETADGDELKASFVRLAISDTGRAWTRRRCAGPWSRSSPPNRQVREPGSGSPACTASSAPPAVSSGCTPNPATASP